MDVDTTSEKLQRAIFLITFTQSPSIQKETEMQAVVSMENFKQFLKNSKKFEKKTC